MQAVILAAGMGNRIREQHVLPKGFISFGDTSIIQESMQKLKKVGIADILIVTGYAADYYEDFAKKNHLHTIFNKAYNQFGSLYSLYCAKDWIKDDFLLLESDIIYEKRALEKISQHKNPNVILLSGETNSNDEVYVQACNKKLIQMSKQKNKLVQNEIYGEFVGINRLSLTDYQRLTLMLSRDQHLLETGCYDEQGLVAMTQYCEVDCLKITDLLWSEIDNFAQFQRAKALYPFIDMEIVV
ncbi:MAG: sugar nucleotidyltransferase [Gammaproteobacteria bacterium CG_4_10_14_0_8_um_filter_38_16]|nr:MAG: sugar nucleotidyltransferase [Gammaproteobacteria bacterium CG_4_10_14_0_8_um_filter_38_16]PJA03715.1 MAG: sugar nucleotidyltransferase [Gammaproteobacteria bacterium CG_4_10_14_0_2_um_filter_38_22]